MKILRAALAAAIAFIASAATAQQDSTQVQSAPPVAVESMTFCTAVENREAVGESTSFGADTGTVCCITRITGAAGETTVTHVWYAGDEEVSRVELPVRAASWRTWSCKSIAAPGTWRVEVQAADGKVLQSGTFTVGAAGGQ